MCVCAIFLGGVLNKRPCLFVCLFVCLFDGRGTIQSFPSDTEHIVDSLKGDPMSGKSILKLLKMKKKRITACNLFLHQLSCHTAGAGETIPLLVPGRLPLQI